MNYQKIYDSLCKRGQTNERYQMLKDSGTYYETHHIVPRCFGGSDDPSNLTKLTAREHFLCHWLLYKIFKDDHNHDRREVAKICRAFARMSTCNTIQSRNLTITSVQYEQIQKARSLAMSFDPPWYHRSAESKQKFIDYAKQPKSELHKQRISESNKGFRNFTNTVTGENIKIKINSKRFQEVINDSMWIPTQHVYGKTRYRNKQTGDIVFVGLKDTDIRNDDRWEYWSTGMASYRNKQTGETCMLSKDDPRVTNGQWESTSINRHVMYNKVTGETKCVSLDEVLNDEWVPMHQGKRKYRHKITGEISTMLVNNPLLKTGEWEPCAEHRMWTMFNPEDRSIFQGDRFDKEDVDKWIRLKDTTDLINVYTLEITKFVSVDQLKDPHLWPLTNQTLVFDTVEKKLCYMSKGFDTVRYKSRSALVCIIKPLGNDVYRYKRVPIVMAYDMIDNEGWFRTTIVNKHYCVYRDKVTNELYYLLRDSIIPSHYERFYKARGVLL